MTIGMAAMRLLSIVLIGAGLGLAQTADAQGQKKNGDQQDAGANAQCARLPGGNAPVDRIARLSGQLSINSLRYTYFDKPLSELTSSDFDAIEALTATCRGSTGDAMKESRAFRAKVEEANAARGKTLDWIEKSQVEIGRMKGGPADLERLQELWVEMLARSQEMLPTDRAPLARAIVLKQDEIYKATDLPRQSPVWPPEPVTAPVTGQAPR